MLNSAAAIYVSGNVSTFEEGVAVALETIESGAAYTQLQRLKSKRWLNMLNKIIETKRRNSKPTVTRTAKCYKTIILEALSNPNRELALIAEVKSLSFQRINKREFSACGNC